MRLISTIILLMYLSVAINGIAYAGVNASAGFSALNLNSTAAAVYEQDYARMSPLPKRLSAKDALSDFAQDIPQMQGYDWSRIRQENNKLFALFCEI